MKKLDLIIIGIDGATDPKNRGVAVGIHENSRCLVSLPVGVWTDENIGILVSDYFKEAERVLIAIDAPLGWPEKLSQMLIGHKAGLPLTVPANNLFRRITDCFIKEKTGQQSLDVGADRIARTAHSALGILNTVSRKINVPVPLAWNSDIHGVAAIEVYPAATLKACRLRNCGYKGINNSIARQEIIDGLSALAFFQLPRNIQPLLDDSDTLDAVVCVLAGNDFLLNKAYVPSEEIRNVANKEGWIWVRQQKSERS